MKFHLPTLSLLAVMLAMSACGKTAEPEGNTPTVGGARSGVLSIDSLITVSTKAQVQRRAALLGIFVAEYISFAQTAQAAQGALTGIAVDEQIMVGQHTITDPDFDLLQAFADALQVDVPDLLNRSTDRQETLQAYTTGLTNAAKRSNERFQTLSGTLEEQKTLLRTQGKELTTAERELKNAISKKDFSEAGEKQKTVLEAQAVYANTDLKRKQTEDIVETFDSLLTLYSEKIQAIQQNREVLIAGNRIVDVPGIEELQILEKKKATRRSGRGATQFNSLFEEEVNE